MLALAKSLGATYATFRPTIETQPDRPGVASADRRWVLNAYATLKALAQEAHVEIDLERFLAYQRWESHGYSSCTGIRLNATVTPDGRVWVCPQRRGVTGSCLGDLTAESFGDIWARHPGQWAVDGGCRVMCRLHPVNETLSALAAPRPHGAFV
jgi:hypothetical protein